MTAAFVGFGVNMALFAPALQQALGASRLLRWAVAGTGISTLAVASFPVSRSGDQLQDRLHGLAAVASYLGCALSPAIAATTLAAQGREVAARRSRLVACLAALSLAKSLQIRHRGLFQRAGLTLADVWFATMAISEYRRLTD